MLDLKSLHIYWFVSYLFDGKSAKGELKKHANKNKIYSIIINIFVFCVSVYLNGYYLAKKSYNFKILDTFPKESLQVIRKCMDIRKTFFKYMFVIFWYIYYLCDSVVQKPIKLVCLVVSVSENV